MKVVKMWRLLTKKDHQFQKDGQKQIVRTDMILTENYIEEQNAISGDTGLYYEVDDKATAKRDKAASSTDLA